VSIVNFEEQGANAGENAVRSANDWLLWRRASGVDVQVWLSAWKVSQQVGE
jgi:hypothetical protein